MKYQPAAHLTLYRSPSHPMHWIVWSDRAGWLIFPARTGGWADRSAFGEVNPSRLQQVPLWMGFNTGLLEAAICKAA